MADIAIFDVDGTLVDTNYQHALAWYRALRRYDVIRPLWRIHRAVGMGGDQLVPHVAGEDVEREHGDDLRAAWAQELEPMIGEVTAFEGAHELLQEVKARGFTLVLASSGQREQVQHFMELVGATDLADAWTSADDVGSSKPAPDLVAVALERVGGGSGVMVGDSPWDAVAAGKVGVPVVGLRTGGFAAEELREAGAVQVFDSLVELRERLDETPLAGPGR